MAIRKFTESNIISTERTGDLINDFKNILFDYQDKLEALNSYRNEFDNYKSSDKKANNHIDDCVIELQKLSKNIEDSIVNLETIISNLNISSDNSNSDENKYDF